MATPNLDPQAVLAAVYKAGRVCQAFKLFPGVRRKEFQTFCRQHGITGELARKQFSGADNVTVNIPPHVQPKITYRIAQKGCASSGKIKVLAIGDAHDSPHIPDKARFGWIGRHARDAGVDILLSIGDLFSLDSLCSHERNDTLRGKAKPTFREDMASAKQALAALDEGLGGFAPERHVTLGNHEDRIFSFTNRTPEIAAMMDENLHTILSDAGWNYSPFGATHYVGGVGFTHVPLNTMGKPYGGMYAENQISRDALEDMVFGHSHKRLEKTYPKIGGRHLTVINLGCALPDGHIEEYARHSLTGWSYGVYELTLQRGSIQKALWTPMAELAERYG